VQVAGQYTQAVAAIPTFNPSGGNFAPDRFPVEVSIATTTPGATIRYLINDGVTPHVTENSPVYHTPVDVGPDKYLHAKTFKTGYITSLERVENYHQMPQCATPVFTPASGPYPEADYPKAITITTVTPGAQIRYRLNDDDVEHGTVAPSGVVVNVEAGDTLYAIAQKTGFVNSTTKVGTYTVQVTQVSEPTVSPPGGSYNNHNITVTFH
jgi:LysM repeat protein